MKIEIVETVEYKLRHMMARVIENRSTLWGLCVAVWTKGGGSYEIPLPNIEPKI